jgi:hypothetical protein
MIPTLVVDEKRLTQVLDGMAPAVRERLIETLEPIAAEIQADAKARAEEHIRYLGSKNPGSYVESIQHGVAAKRERKVTGYVRSGHPLAHLLEDGFTIKDMMIQSADGGVMAFQDELGMHFARDVHRHETKVKAYPAIRPAFEARRDDILAALEAVARESGQGTG